MRFAFYVSGRASRLSKIIGEGNKDLLDDTKLVFSDDNSANYLSDQLDKYNINYTLLDYKSLSKDNCRNLMLSRELLKKLKLHSIDYCFCFGSHILKGEILNCYKNKIINFHPSILPLFPGKNAIDQAIQRGVSLLGNTAHFIDSGIDTGPIIMQNVLSVETYYKYGYDAILDNQITMLYQIYECLKFDKLYIEDNRVKIRGANYKGVVFFPGINQG